MWIAGEWDRPELTTNYVITATKKLKEQGLMLPLPEAPKPIQTDRGTEYIHTLPAVAEHSEASLDIIPSFRKETGNRLEQQLMVHQPSGQGRDCAFAVVWAFLVIHRAGITQVDHMPIVSYRNMNEFQQLAIKASLKFVGPEEMTHDRAQTIMNLFVAAARRYMAHDGPPSLRSDYGDDPSCWGSLPDILEEALKGFRFCCFTADTEAYECTSCHELFCRQDAGRSKNRQHQLILPQRIRSTLSEYTDVREGLQQVFGPRKSERHHETCHHRLDEITIVFDRLPPVLVLGVGWYGPAASGNLSRKPLPGTFEPVIEFTAIEGNDNRRHTVQYRCAGFFDHPNGNHFTYTFRRPDDTWVQFDSEKSTIAEVDPHKLVSLVACVLHRITK